MKAVENNSLDIIKTADGSCTLYNKQLDETYHSVNGAATESKHVYITNGLLRYNGKINDIHILEIGLGTGLNALLTIENKPISKSIYYTAIEPFPIPFEMAESYFNKFDCKPIRLDLLAQVIAPNNDQFSEICEGFFYRCSKLPLQILSYEDLTHAYSVISKIFSGFDIIYYDAFAPQKQPDMWELETLKKATDLLTLNGILTSYCAQGQFKRHLKSLDLFVQSLPGPPGKREITVAKK